MVQAGIEERAMALWPENKPLAREMLTLFTHGAVSRAMEQAEVKH